MYKVEQLLLENEWHHLESLCKVVRSQHCSAQFPPWIVAGRSISQRPDDYEELPNIYVATDCLCLEEDQIRQAVRIQLSAPM